jgi:hypothetical protein
LETASRELLSGAEVETLRRRAFLKVLATFPGNGRG